MFHKSQTAIKNYSKTLNYQKIAVKLSTRKSRVSSKSPKNTKKRITPRIRSSFTICDEIYSPHSRLRSTSVDRKNKNTSFDYSGLRKAHHAANSFQKFDEKVYQFINLGRQEIQKGKLSEAISHFSQALEIDNKCLDALYNKGIANMLKGHYKEATIDFLNVLRENILYNKDVYLKIAICFSSMKETNTAIRYITQGLHRFPKLFEGYLYRGQLYNETKQWEKAMTDFKKVLNSSNDEGTALLGIAESLEGIGDLESAIKMLEQAQNTPDTFKVALLRKGILKCKINDLTAISDLDAYLEQEPTCSQAFFHKAEILYSSNQFPESALCYEQCIKYDSNYEYSPRAIFHLGAIKIHEKDFYGALHTFERAGKHELKDQKILQHYAEAVINLMKRKYKDGISTFNKLLKKQDPIMKQYFGNCYMYRGYGYNALNLHEKAIRSFKKAATFGKLNKASQYNQELSYALLAASKSNVQGCLTYLEKCLKIFPKKAEPYIYQAALSLSQFFTTQDDTKIIESEELLTQAMKMKEVDSEMLFFRASVRYLQEKISLALEDVKQAIEKAEDNIAEHYILRGLCYASERSYTESVQDFTIALQLKEGLDYVHWYRSRVAYLLDDTNLAFADLQKYMIARPNDSEAYLKAAVLLIMGGSYDDALKALSNSIALKPNSQAVYLKAKCFVIMNEISEALKELRSLKEQSPGTSLDIEILTSLQNAKFKEWAKHDFLSAAEVCFRWSQQVIGEIFELKHILWLRGVYLMYSDEYSLALTEFQTVLELLHQNEGVVSADEALTTEEENCEILYNISICHSKSKKSQSLVILNDLSEILNSKHRGQMLLLSSIIQLSLNNNASAEKTLKEAFRCDPESVTPFLSKKTTTILPLNTSNPFAQMFPFLNLDLSVDPVIRIRPAISLPRSKLPNIEFLIEKEAKEFFSIAKITSRPEAPWLNRVKGSIQFTSTLVEIDEPSQISERDLEENKEIKESYSDFKRKIKSDLPIRHFSSNFNKNEAKVAEKYEEEPEEIIDKIKDFCKRNKHGSNYE